MKWVTRQRVKVEALLLFGLHAERRGRRRALQVIVHRRELQTENSEIENGAANRQGREQHTRIQRGEASLDAETHGRARS